jgi:hypothetical protein
MKSVDTRRGEEVEAAPLPKREAEAKKQKVATAA